MVGTASASLIYVSTITPVVHGVAPPMLGRSSSAVAMTGGSALGQPRLRLVSLRSSAISMVVDGEEHPRPSQSTELHPAAAPPSVEEAAREINALLPKLQTPTQPKAAASSSRPRLGIGRILVAIAYGKYGVLYPFLPVYLKAYLQLPALWIGVLTMIFPFCIAVVSPMITSFADACGKHKEIFLATQLMSAAFAVALYLVGGQVWLIFALLLSWAVSDTASEQQRQVETHATVVAMQPHNSQPGLPSAERVLWSRWRQ